MAAYDDLSRYYDAINAAVDYAAWADYVTNHFRRAGIQVKDVLELACGTGSLSHLLAGRGYDMTSVDISPGMLSEAIKKAPVGSRNPMFLCQDMSKLDLFGTVDAAICCLDSVNYLTDPKKLARAFSRVGLFLNPGGIFIFDINTREKFEDMDERSFIIETGDVFCAWSTRFSKPLRICRHEIDVFVREGHAWSRFSESHRERAYGADELRDMLKASGFHDIRTYGDMSFRRPREREHRIFFTARKNK